MNGSIFEAGRISSRCLHLSINITHREVTQHLQVTQAGMCRNVVFVRYTTRLSSAVTDEDDSKRYEPTKEHIFLL